MRLDRGVAGVGTIAAAAAGGQLVEIAAAVLAQLSPPQLAARRSPNYAGQPECSVRRPRFSRRRCISSISVGQFGNVWTHDYTVIVDENGSFSGTGSVSDNGAAVATWTEQITGTFNADKTVSFATIPDGGGATFEVTNAPMNNSTVPVVSTWTANEIEFQISPPVVTTAATTTPGTESVKNHGQFVKAQGGGKVAAQACAGMPVNSTQGK